MIFLKAFRPAFCAMWGAVLFFNNLSAQTLAGPVDPADPRTSLANWEQNMSESESARRAGEYAAAHASCQKALLIARLFPRPDTHLAQTLVQIGNIAMSERKFDLAETQFKEAVHSCELSVGADHPVMIMPLESLANCYFASSRFDQVAPIYQRILEITQRGVVLQNLEVGRRSKNLADVYVSLAKYDRAEPLYIRAIELAEPSGNISDLVQFRMAAGHMYETWGKIEAAAIQYTKAADLAIGLNNDFDSFQALQALTELRKKAGAFPDAAAAGARAVALREIRLKTDDSGDAKLDLAVSLANLAEVYAAWKQPEHAEPLYQRAFEISKKESAPGSGETVSCLIGVAKAQQAEGHLTEAERTYAKALLLFDHEGSQGTPQMQELAENYAAVLRQLKKPEDANRLLVRIKTNPKVSLVP